MVKLWFTDVSGQRSLVDATLGETLMQAAVTHGVEGIEGACGGCLSCGTCHAYIAEPWFSALPTIKPEEQSMLECAAHPAANSRQLCQVHVTADLDGAEITVPPSQV